MLEGSNIIVLDLETVRSAEDCKWCNYPNKAHKQPDGICYPHGENDPIGPQTYTPIGWSNKPALGLSIGGYYSYMDDRVHWFDEHNIVEVMAELVEIKPLMVSFNGIQFDFPLMRGILRQRANSDRVKDEKSGLQATIHILDLLCDDFKVLATNSYDILAEIWKADPESKFIKGLNSLDAISQANGLSAKLNHGAQAPRDWQAEKYADVINYCQDDILKTKALFEMICKEGIIARSNHIVLQLSIPEIENPSP